MIASMFYMGGVFAAYRTQRSGGQGRIGSAFDAICWPVGLGYAVCRKFYDPSWDE